MITIYLSDPGTATSAIKWCDQNISSKDWNLHVLWPAAGYNFEFKNSESAMLFSLKWTEPG